MIDFTYILTKDVPFYYTWFSVKFGIIGRVYVEHDYGLFEEVQIKRNWSAGSGAISLEWKKG